MGAIPLGSWLPTLSDGSSLGSRPAALSDRFVDFNQRFADSWRVSQTDSLFDYAPGQSTDDFTLRNWPPEKPPCIVPNSKIPPTEPMHPDRAKSVCSRIINKVMRAQCVMDVTATGDPIFAKTYLTSQALRALRVDAHTKLTP
jgi:lysyl endopeptidase